MPSPFPGMDPYLEDSAVWSGFHQSLAAELKRQLNHKLDPKYYADIEVYTEPQSISIDMASEYPIRPDVSVFEPSDIVSEPTVAAGATIAPAPVLRAAITSVRLRAVHVYRTKTSELVTAIEILSLYNKRAGEGLDQYRRKRSQLLLSRTHLLKLDLLRGGERPGYEVYNEPFDTEYVLLCNRASGHRMSEIWPVALNEPLPILPVPLMSPDPDVPLDLSSAIHAVYTDSRYDMRINYRHPMPPPPLRPVIAAWFEGWQQKQAKFQN